MRGAGSLYLICVGLLFCVAGGGFAWLMWRSYDRASGQRDWVEVDCTIIESRIEELSDEQRELVDRMAAETVRRTER